MDPIKLLLLNSNSVNWMKLPETISGMVPVSSLPSKYKSCISRGVEYCGGIAPVKVLLVKYAFVRVSTRKMPAGRVPLNWFLDTSKNSSCLNSSKKSGNSPVNLLLLRSRFPVV
jgi:hypothetical protein